MGTTVKVICYKSKVLSNNECPLMVRVTKDRKLKYVSLGVSVNPEYWDFSQQEPKLDCPDREYLELLIADKIKEYKSKIIELQATNQPYTSSTLVEKVCLNRLNRNSVEDVFQTQMKRLSSVGRRNYYLSVKQLYNSLIEFNNHLNIPFSDIDISWLRKYEVFLRDRGLADGKHNNFQPPQNRREAAHQAPPPRSP